MNIASYAVWYSYGATLEELTTCVYFESACFAVLKGNTFPRFFKAKFSNRYDKFKNNEGHSTQEWLEEFSLSTLATSGIVNIEVEQDYYYVTLDLSILSYQWAFSILTLLRYPGEYYNICWNYWKIREKMPTLSKWEALYLAHQGTWYKEYQAIFGAYDYDAGHSLFKHGQKLCNINIENTFAVLEEYPSNMSKEKTITWIQDIWGGVGYDDYTNFDISKWKATPHINIKE